MAQRTGTAALHTSLPVPSAVRQIDGLQVLRAAAVTIVAWGHAGLYYMGGGATHLPDMGVFGIDIFFVLSGFILAAVVLRSGERPGVRTAWGFFKRRLIRIFPIYWVFAAVSIVLLLHRHDLKPGALYSLLLLPFPQYPYMPLLANFTWTLTFELWFYLLLGAIQVFTIRRSVEVLLCVLLALVALRLVTPIQRPVLIVVANPMLLEFAYGAIIALAYRAWGRHRAYGVCLLVAGVAAAFGLLAGHVSSPTQQLILLDEQVLFRVATWGVAAAAIVAGTVFCEGAARGRPGALLVALGNASYSAYLASALTIYACSRVLLSVIPAQFAMALPVRALCQVLSVVAVLVVGLGTYHSIERPMLRGLQKRFVSP